MGRRKRSSRILRACLTIWIPIFGLVLTGRPQACEQGTAASKGKPMSVTYQATPRQNRWIAGARVVLDLQIENNGSEPFETYDPMYRTSPQPHFEVTGPDGRKQEFQPDSQALDWDRGRSPTMVRLAPGHDWAGDFPLSVYANLNRPGRYTLRTWIEQPRGPRIESPVAEFEILRANTVDLTTETSIGEEGNRVVECVELLAGGVVTSSILQERDPSNAELGPFNRLERGETDPSATAVLAPFSNFSVGLSSLRWIVAEKNHKLIIGHSLQPTRLLGFGGGDLSRILPPVATEAGLYVAAVRGLDLVLTRVTGSESGLAEGPEWSVEKLEVVPTATSLTVSSPAAGSVLLFVLAWDMGKATRVQFLTVDREGKVITRIEHTIADWQPLGPAAVGWAAGGETRASLLLRNPVKQGEIRAGEVQLLPNLSLREAPRVSDPVLLDSPIHDVRLEYFESMAGHLGRMVLIRTASGRVWIIPSTGTIRAPKTKIPGSGPLAILPGQRHWYAAWPENGILSIGPL